MSPRTHVSLQHAIAELEREVTCIVDLESDPVLRGLLAIRNDLTIDNVVKSIKDNLLEGKLIRHGGGALDLKVHDPRKRTPSS